MSTPPAGVPPWRTGVHAGHDVVEVRVMVCRDKFDQDWSYHEMATPQDQEIVLKWPTGGTRHVAEALLIESLRRHAILLLLREASRDPAYLGNLPTLEAEVVEKLGLTLQEEVTRIVSGVCEAAVRDAIRDVSG